MFHKVKEYPKDNVFDAVPDKNSFCRFCVKFAYMKANALPQSKEGKEALALVKKWLNGENVTRQQLRNVARDVWHAAADVAYAAAAAAAWTANAAAAAAAWTANAAAAAAAWTANAAAWTANAALTAADVAYAAAWTAYAAAVSWTTVCSEAKEFFRQIALNFLCYEKQQWDFNIKQWKTLLIQGLNDNDKDLVNIAITDFPEDESFTTSFIQDIRRFYNTQEDIVSFMFKKKDEIILLLEEIF